MKVSEIYGKPVERIDGKKRGYILGISRAGDRIEGYICCNENETEFFAAHDTARFKGEIAIVSKTGKPTKRGDGLKLGYAVYTENGKFLGHVDDYTVKKDRILYAHVGKRKIRFNSLSFGDVAIVKSAEPVAEIAAKDMFIDALCRE